MRERQQLAKKLYKSLQCLQCTDNASPLVREKSRSYAMPHYIKVYEMTFSFTLHDESAMPNGYIIEPNIVRSVEPSLDNEALRLIKMLPQWKPGTLKGKAVKVKYTVPVAFKLK